MNNGVIEQRGSVFESLAPNVPKNVPVDVPPYFFSWPYEVNVQNAPFVGWYPINERGVEFDLIARQTRSIGGWTNTEDRLTTLPNPTVTGGPLRSMVMTADDDSLLYLNGAEFPVYLPGGCPVKLSLDGVTRMNVRPSYNGENHDIKSLTVGTGLMATFSNQPECPEFLGRYPLWYQRTIMTGAAKNITKDTATGTADLWKAIVLAPAFDTTPEVGASNYAVAAANVLTPSAWTSAVRTSHLSHKVFTVSAADSPVIVRLQGVLVKANDAAQIIVDDPATDEGITLDAGESLRISTEEQYGMMRLLLALPTVAALNDTAEIAVEMAARFAAGG